MILTKEFPATHSMSTSWFGIDSEGNVAILDFNDNGPVPDGVPDTGPEDVICEEFVDLKMDIPHLDFNDSQAKEILKELEDYRGDEDRYSVYSTIIQIHLVRQEEFEALIKKCNEEAASEFDRKTILLNKGLGLYILDTSGWDDTQVKQLLESGIIKKRLPHELSIWLNDLWDNEKNRPYYEVTFFNLPFFAFKEPYWPQIPMEKAYIPRYPFKADKLPREARQRAFHFDFSFNEVAELQIARFFPYRMHSGEDGKLEDGIEYTWLPISEKEEGLLPENSIPYARKEASCTHHSAAYSELTNPGIHFYPSQATFEPKYIRLTLCTEYATDSPLRQVNGSLARLPIISFYPISKDDKIRNENRSISSWQLEREMKYDLRIIKERFKVEKPYFESTINRFRPYLLILSNKSMALLKDFYDIVGSHIRIGEYAYQFVVCDVLKPDNVSFDKWEDLPYRGFINQKYIQKRERTND